MTGDATFTLAVAKSTVAGKLRNQRAVVQRGARESKAQEDDCVGSGLL